MAKAAVSPRSTIRTTRGIRTGERQVDKNIYSFGSGRRWAVPAVPTRS